MKTYTHNIYTKNSKLFKILLLTLSLCFGSTNLNAQLQEAFVETPPVKSSATNQTTTAKAGEPQEALEPAKPSSASSAKSTKLDKDTKNQTTKSASTSKKQNSKSIGEIISSLLIVFFGIFVFSVIISHITMILFFYDTMFVSRKLKKYSKEVDFSAERKKLGLNIESTFEENAKCLELLEKGFSDWANITEGGVEVYACPSRSAYKSALNALREVYKIMPTDPELCSAYTIKCDSFESESARSFEGSKGGMFAAACVMFVLPQFIPYLIFSIALYIFASYAPRFLSRKRSASGMRPVLGALIGFAGADFMQGKHSVTTTKWSDGSKTVEKDYTQSIVSLVLALVLIMLIAMLMSLIALFNYLRNYVFYF